MRGYVCEVYTTNNQGQRVFRDERELAIANNRHVHALWNDKVQYVGGDEFPGYRKEYITGAKMNVMLQQKKIGSMASRKVYGLVDFIEFKKKLNLTPKEKRETYSELEAALDCYYNNDTGTSSLVGKDLAPWKTQRKIGQNKSNVR